MNGNISKEGITVQISEAFARVGLGATQQFSSSAAPSHRWMIRRSPSCRRTGQRRSWNNSRFRSPLDLVWISGTHNTPGWSSSGGPWITPAQSMQKIIFAETAYHGPGPFPGSTPHHAISHDYYEDIAVLAFPKIGDGQVDPTKQHRRRSSPKISHPTGSLALRCQGRVDHHPLWPYHHRQNQHRRPELRYRPGSR